MKKYKKSVELIIEEGFRGDSKLILFLMVNLLIVGVGLGLGYHLAVKGITEVTWVGLKVLFSALAVSGVNGLILFEAKLLDAKMITIPNLLGLFVVTLIGSQVFESLHQGLGWTIIPFILGVITNLVIIVGFIDLKKDKKNSVRRG